jgi:hypothetical protein
MKKIRFRRNVAFILSVIFFSTIGINNLYSQKVKKEEIFNKGLGVNNHVMYANLYLGDNNKVESREIVLAGQDQRYTQIASLLISYKGSPKDLYNFMNKVEKFYNENEADVYDTIEGRKIRRAKYGIGISLADDNGEAGYDIKTWKKIKVALVEWAKKNNEPLE